MATPTTTTTTAERAARPGSHVLDNVRLLRARSEAARELQRLVRLPGRVTVALSGRRAALCRALPLSGATLDVVV